MPGVVSCKSCGAECPLPVRGVEVRCPRCAAVVLDEPSRVEAASNRFDFASSAPASAGTIGASSSASRRGSLFAQIARWDRVGRGAALVFAGGSIIFLAVALTAIIQILALATEDGGSYVHIDAWTHFLRDGWTGVVYFANFVRVLGTLGVLVGAGVTGSGIFLWFRSANPHGKRWLLAGTASLSIAVGAAVMMPPVIGLLRKIPSISNYTIDSREGIPTSTRPWLGVIVKAILFLASAAAMLSSSCLLQFVRQSDCSKANQRLRFWLLMYLLALVGSQLGIMLLDFGTDILIRAMGSREMSLRQMSTIFWFVIWLVCSLAVLIWGAILVLRVQRSAETLSPSSPTQALG